MRRLAFIAVWFLVTIGLLDSTASGNWTVTLGASDGIAIAQPMVQVGVYNGNTLLGPVGMDDEGNPLNSFVLDTGATSILASQTATDNLTSNPAFHTVAIYNEAGISGRSETHVSDLYGFTYAGTDGVQQPAGNVRILASQVDLGGLGGVAGTPILVHHSTTIDLAHLTADTTSFLPTIGVSFSTAPPSPSGNGLGHRYTVPLKMVNFPLDGQVNLGDPLPTAAPLSMAPVQLRNGTNVVESRFIVDTGAQISFISSRLATALGIDLSHPIDSVPLGGVGGTVEMPIYAADSLALHTSQGKDLVWTDVPIGVLDIDSSFTGVFGMDFLTSGWLDAIFGGGGNGYVSQVHFDFRNSDNLIGEMLVDVDPAHDGSNISDHSATWDFTGSGSFNQATNWYSPAVPNGTGVSATFGDGILNTIAGPTVTVNIDGAQVLGKIAFTSTQGLGYVLAGDGVSGHGIKLDNNGLGATVSVVSGVTALQQIQANLVLADNATFNIATGSTLSISVGGISETGGSRGISLTGGGTLTMAAPSSYTGGTTVSGGTLTTTGAGTLGSGFLALNGSSTAASVVNLGSSQTVTSLSGSLAGGGTARVNVPATKSLTVNQANNTYFEGSVSLAAGAAPAGGGKLIKSDVGTLELDVVPMFGDYSSISVTGGVLRLTTTPDSSGAVLVGTGVTATIANAATLELAGSVSSMSNGANRVHVVNSSMAVAGLLVSGTNQVVGAIDGSGTTQVNAGGLLTADHIIQTALVIGGAAGDPATLTIDASNALGSPLAGASSLAIAGALDAGGTYPADMNAISSSAGAGTDPNSSGTGLAPDGAGTASAAVPEPSSVLLLLLGGMAILIAARRHSPR